MTEDTLPPAAREFLHAAGVDRGGVETRTLGSDPAMVARILAVIRSGEKSMTFSVPALTRAGGRASPEPGHYLLLLDAEGEPAVLVRLTEVRELPFGAVDKETLAREGAPMRDPEAWKALHERIWNERLASLGRTVSDTLPVRAEYFELVAKA